MTEEETAQAIMRRAARILDRCAHVIAGELLDQPTRPSSTAATRQAMTDARAEADRLRTAADKLDPQP